MSRLLRFQLIAGLATLLGLSLCACSESTTAAAPDAGADGAAADGLALPPCVAACDRVAECFVEDCPALDWQAAGTVFRDCAAICDPSFASEAAGLSCDALVDLTRSSAPDLALLCDAPCDAGCGRFADCAVDGCDGLGAADRDGVFMACSAWCTPEVAGDLLLARCADVVTILRDNPEYATACGGSRTCPGPALCEPFAARVTSCVIEHCAGNAEAFETGISEVLFDYCSSAEDCPAEDGVAFIIDATCDMPPLDTFGPAAPFTAICDGTFGTVSAEVGAACDRLLSCGVPLRSRDTCLVLISFGADPSSLATCVTAAADCTGAQACLGGP